MNSDSELPRLFNDTEQLILEIPEIVSLRNRLEAEDPAADPVNEGIPSRGYMSLSTGSMWVSEPGMISAMTSGGFSYERPR